MGVLCYLPVLHVICCCGKRCRMVCKYLKFTDDESDIICSDMIWVSYDVRRRRISICSIDTRTTVGGLFTTIPISSECQERHPTRYLDVAVARRSSYTRGAYQSPVKTFAEPTSRRTCFTT